ncbi:hypothetical protein DFJ74DRAFT_736023, partial [Hyaloraphidium curvatum]
RHPQTNPATAPESVSFGDLDIAFRTKADKWPTWSTRSPRARRRRPTACRKWKTPSWWLSWRNRCSSRSRRSRRRGRPRRRRSPQTRACRRAYRCRISSKRCPRRFAQGSTGASIGTSAWRDMRPLSTLPCYRMRRKRIYSTSWLRYGRRSRGCGRKLCSTHARISSASWA